MRTQWAGVAIRLLCPEEDGNWPAEKEEKRGQRRGREEDRWQKEGEKGRGKELATF